MWFLVGFCVLICCSAADESRRVFETLANGILDGLWDARVVVVVGDFGLEVVGGDMCGCGLC